MVQNLELLMRIDTSTAISEKTAPRMPTVSVVVPVYNGSATLDRLVDRLLATLNAVVSNSEIILVNDASIDNSWETIERLAQARPRVRGINLMKNYGQHNATLAGVLSSRFDVIITIDDDLQHRPENIPLLLDKLHEGYDVVYGKPAQRRHDSWRNLSSRILKLALTIVLGADHARHTSSYRVFHRRLCRGFQDFHDASLSFDVLLSWSANFVTHVPVEHSARAIGTSGYTLRKLILLTFSAVTGYSTIPLRIASILGFVTSGFGLGLFIYIVIRRLVQESYVPGFAFLAAETALFAGLQLFAIGVLGEYLARVHFRTMGKPPFVVRETIGDFHPDQRFSATSPSPHDSLDKAKLESRR